METQSGQQLNEEFNAYFLKNMNIFFYDTQCLTLFNKLDAKMPKEQLVLNIQSRQS
jgi:hypothetical protein